jgi:hypothetical protein
VGVERGAPGLCPRGLGAEQAPQLGPLGGEAIVVVIEDVRDRSPPRPAGKYGLLVGGGPAVLVLAAAQRGESVEVGAQLGGGPGRGQVVLAGRLERGRPLGCGGARVVMPVAECIGAGYRGWLIVRLISSSSR